MTHSFSLTNTQAHAKVHIMDMVISAQFGLGRISSGLLAPSATVVRSVTAEVRPSMSVRCATAGESSFVPLDSAEFDKKQFRHNLTRSNNYNKRGFGHKEEAIALMNHDFMFSFFLILINFKSEINL